MEVTHWEDPLGAAWWLSDLNDVAPAAWGGLFAQMAPARQMRCQRYRREADQRRCILADALIRHALSRETGAEAASIVFELQPGGKPQAVGLDMEFSLSHSGSLVLCATAPFPVGVDLQRHRALSPALVRRLARAGYEGNSDTEFFSWWVRQESAGKLTGKGLSLSPLPSGLGFSQRTLERADGTYSCCLCTKKSSLPSQKMV